MNGLMLTLYLAFTFGISFLNAYSSGAYFTESKLIGGWTRFLTWCGLIMSACGFTWVYLTIMTMAAIHMEKLTPEWGLVMMKLGYLIIILPVLGSGLGIWIHSLTNAYRNRSFGNIAVAGWNTYAQVRNTWEAASHAPNYLKDVMDAFSPKGKRGGKNDGAAALLVIMLVILAVFGGAITTGLIARWADRRVAINVRRPQPA